MVAVSAVVKGRNFKVSQSEITCLNAIGSEIISTQLLPYQRGYHDLLN
jgi:hypothetical protein